jgi:hypothetical protein
MLRSRSISAFASVSVSAQIAFLLLVCSGAIAAERDARAEARIAPVAETEPGPDEVDLERLAQRFEEAVAAAVERTTALEIAALRERSEASLALFWEAGLRASVVGSAGRSRSGVRMVRVDEAGLDDEARSSGARSTAVTPDWLPLERTLQRRAAQPSPAKAR